MSEERESASDHHHHHRSEWNGTSNAVYGMGFLGALVYFIIHATSFLGGVVGVLKAIIWPAILVFKLLEFLNM